VCRAQSGRPRRGYRGERLGVGGVDFDLQRDELLDDHIDLGFEGDDRRAMEPPEDLRR